MKDTIEQLAVDNFMAVYMFGLIAQLFLSIATVHWFPGCNLHSCDL